MDNPHRILLEAAAKEVLARVFESYAGELEAVFKGVPVASGGSRGYWTGDAADRFVDTARQLDRGIVELAESCTLTARTLRRSAEQLRAAVMLPAS
ncbi:WXG100 family type VII secretion target [Acrocarpospora pleiomorpha]|uniref:WXG100 family type VII secretion target n=1 Tax=Acrocarpospora pleiomorpha TaxID=90975 RepID=UPI0012D36220|nr:WXG100 family type VII secretion target [Acrocarpospora pleiomorpha]